MSAPRAVEPPMRLVRRAAVRLVTVTSRRRRYLEAGDGHLLERRRQQLLDVPQQVAILGRHQRDGAAGEARAPGTSRAWRP